MSGIRIPDPLPEAAIDAATRVFCAGLPLPSAGDGIAEHVARGRCLGPDCPCWAQGREVTRAAIRAAACAIQAEGGAR